MSGRQPNLAKLERVAQALGALREQLVSEIVLDVPALRQYLATQCSALLARPGFINALPGMVFPDESLAERVQLLAQRLQQIAKLAA